MNLKSIINEFSKKYGQNAAKMEKRVLEYINGGIAAETAIKRAFADTGLLTDLTADIQAAKLQAVSLGIGYDATGNTEITTALNRPWDGTGVTFSQRIHLGGEQMRTAMVDEIKSQLKLGASAVDVARSLYDGYGYGHIQTKQAAPDYLAEIVAFARRSDLTEKEKQKLLRQIRLAKQAVDNLSQNGAPNQALKTAYSKLLEAVQGSNQANINKAVSVAINEKSRYVAERIARTEAGRAYFDGVIAQYKDNSLVIAYKWELASRHPAEDICDMYAGADLFGLGPGIFPKEICPPMPAHPNCLCLLYPVFRGEADLTKQATSPKSGGIKWLQAHPEAAKNILPVNASADNWISVARGFSGFSNPVSRLPQIENIDAAPSKPVNKYGKEILMLTKNIDIFKTITQLSAEYDTFLTSVASTSNIKAAGTMGMGGNMNLPFKNLAVVYHEFAHSLTQQARVKYGLATEKEILFEKELAKLFTKYKKDVNKNVKYQISSYSMKDKDEFMAEAFRQMKTYGTKEYEVKTLGNDFTYGKKVMDLINRFFKKHK